MFRVFLCDNKLYVFDKSEKEFRARYGNQYEQVSIIRDYDNIEAATDKLLKQYRVQEIILDCKIKRTYGWNYFSEEKQAEISAKISRALKRYIKTEEHKKNLSSGCKHFKSFLGKKHTERTKARIAFMRLGKDPIKGKRWMHNPYTGEEKRGHTLLPGMLWGRSPEAREYLNHINQARSLKNRSP